jgi:hypothetical protein
MEVSIFNLFTVWGSLRNQEGDQWQIWVQPLTGIETPQFKQFTESLNDYLFSVLQVTPRPENSGLPKFEVFFDDIYFDLSGQGPVIEKILKTKGYASLRRRSSSGWLIWPLPICMSSHSIVFPLP